MEHFHTIVAEDVGRGVYRHPMNHPMRAKLVHIAFYFGGILKCDIGRTVLRDNKGRLAFADTLERTKK